jgi:hypothetical protein
VLIKLKRNKMKTINLYITIILVLLISLNIQSQIQGSWILPKDPPDEKINRLNFESLTYSIDVVNTDNPLYFNNLNSAGAFNIAGDLLFYVLNNFAYDTDDHSPIYYTNYADQTGLRPEIQVIKKPGGEENHFFIIYSLYGDYDNENSSINLTEISYTNFMGNEMISKGLTSSIEITQGAGSTTGFALSEEIDGIRDIYYGNSFYGLWSNTIDEYGFSINPQTIATHNSFDPPISLGCFKNNNMEVKTDLNGNTVVAWNTSYSGATNQLFVCTENSPTWTALALSPGLGRIVGLEFSPVEDNIIYLSCYNGANGGGIFKVNYTTGSVLQQLSATGTFNHTFLQTAPNGHIYGVSNDGNYLGKIDMITGAFTPNEVSISVSSVFNDAGFSFYVLPESDFRVLEIEININYVSCPGGCDATATALPLYGDVSDYNWEWTDANNNVVSTTNVAINLCEGEYSVCATLGDYNPVTVCETITVIVDPGLFTHSGGFWEPALPSYTGEHFKFETGLRIINNSTVTLTNCTFEFAKDAKVIIEQGSKLIMNNTTFTSLVQCPAMWQGVEVWGNKLKSQYRQDGQYWQGTLIVNNNSVIENAITAVALWNPQDIYYTTMGGIVQATNSTFHNNARSVHAFWYNNSNPITGVVMDNLSYFKNCTFELNNDYLAEYTFYKHIDLDRVKGIKFQGCDFTLSGTNGVNQWNKGIASYNADFSATAICNSQVLPCTDYDECTFNGFYDAIYASNTGINSNTFQVSRSIFNNNTNGIRMNAVKNATVLFSEFNIGYNAADQGACDGKGSGYGIHMTGCTGFAIEENYFTKAQGAPTGNYTGILVNNCRSFHDIIYKNEFTGLSYGNYAQGINRQDLGNDQHGVEYRCNLNTGNSVDFIVTADIPEEAKIRTYQGLPNLASGNTFSSAANWHYRNEGEENINYYFWDADPFQIPDMQRVYSIDGLYFDDIAADQNTCPSHYGGGGGGGTDGRILLTEGEKLEREQTYFQNLLDYQNVKALFENLKDGGNTQALKTEVETAWPQDMWELRAELLGKSPHLSKEVLMTAADKTNVLPESVLFEILAANPDELKEADLIRYLEEKNQPLPQYMVDILKQLSFGVTYKTILKRQMADYHAGKTQAALDMIRSILADTVLDMQQYRNWLDNLGGLEADKQIIASFLTEGNYNDAQALLNLLPSFYALEGQALLDYNDYKSLMQMQLAWQQQEQNIFELDSAEVAVLADYAEYSAGEAKYLARGILTYAFGYHYCECLTDSDSSFMKSRKTIPSKSFDRMFGLEVTVKPNPAGDWTTFNYQLPDNSSVGIIEITDVSGAVIERFTATGTQGQKVWDTRQIKAGVYFYSLNVSGNNKSGKIVIYK